MKSGQVVELETSRTSQVYQDRLCQGWNLLVIWMATACVTVMVFDDVNLANAILVRFVQDMYEVGERMWLVRHSVLAVQTRFFHLRNRIPRPWDALRGWKKQVRVRSRIPMSSLILDSLFACGLMFGLSHPRFARLYICGVVLLKVGFEALLRPQELLRLRARDVSFVRFEGKLSVVLAISEPKNRGAFGASQFARVQNQSVALWLEWLVRDVPGDVKLWPSDRRRLVNLLGELCRRIEVEELGYTLGSLRPGKATELIMAGVHPGSVKFFGRWASESAFSIYVQESMAMLVWSKLPNNLDTALRSSLAEIETLLSVPPTVPWSTLFNRKSQWRSLIPTKKKLRSWKS